jgi:cell division septum initiation protein DivIVA
MATDHTDQPTEKVPVVRQPWTVTQLDTRRAALTKVGPRRTPGYAIAEADALFSDYGATIVEYAGKLQAEVDGKSRLAQEHTRLLAENRALRERLDSIEGRERHAVPARAVAEVKGATRQGEHGHDLILEDARLRAAQIIEDARSRAANILGADEPAPTGDDVTDLAAEVEWLAGALPVAEQRLRDLRDRKAAKLTEVERRTAELERWGQVLPIARNQLTGGAIEVSEVAS